MYCSTLPAFQKVQMVALSLFGSQSESERKHKDLNEIKTKARNRLGADTLDKLVYAYVYANKELETAIEASSYSEPFLQWNSDNVSQSGDESGVAVDLTATPAKDGLKPRSFGFLFKPIGRAWKSSVSTSKRTKGPDGSPAAPGHGVDDDAIKKFDTIVIPIEQFSFSAAEIAKRFGGDADASMRGVVTHTTTNTIRIKFDGDTCVSPYPKQGYGEYVVVRSYRARHASFIDLGFGSDGKLALSEFHINEIMFHDYLEGDLLNVAMAKYFPAVDTLATVVSCYFVTCGALEKLTEQYSSHIDFGLHKAIFFPTQVHQHWPLLVYSTLDQKLYSLDSGPTLAGRSSSRTRTRTIPLPSIRSRPLSTTTAAAPPPLLLSLLAHHRAWQ
jgi:hypothetical protein